MTIDLWVTDLKGTPIEASLTFMLLLQLGHILYQTDIWKKNTSVRILGFVEHEKEIQPLKNSINDFLLRARFVGYRVTVMPFFKFSPSTLIISFQVFALENTALVSYEQQSRTGFYSLPMIQRVRVVNELIALHAANSC